MSAKDGVGAEECRKAFPGEEADKQTGTSDTTETLFGKFKSSIPSSKVSSAFQKLKEARVSEMMKKGYDVVKDELYGNTNARKHLEYTPPPSFSGEISTKTDIAVLPSKQSRWSKKWEAIREKVILLMLHEFSLQNKATYFILSCFFTVMIMFSDLLNPDARSSFIQAFCWSQ